MEGDLALHGIDLRDLYRPGSGMTMRRLHVLVRALPNDALFRCEIRAAEEKAKVATESQIRARQQHYRRQTRGGPR